MRLLLALLIIPFSSTLGQIYIPEGDLNMVTNSTNNVGIGTPIPDAKLKIISSSGEDIPALSVNGGGDASTEYVSYLLGRSSNFPSTVLRLASNRTASNLYNFIEAIQDEDGSPSTAFLVNGNGRVGISTNSPEEAFQIGDRWTFHNGGHKIIGYNHMISGSSKRIVSEEASAIRLTSEGTIRFEVAPYGLAGSDISFTPALTVENDGDIVWGQGSVLRTDQGGSIDLGGSGSPYIDFSNDATTDYDARFILQTDDAVEFRGANLLIGKSSQANTSYKLDVEGKVRANEIVVNTNGADYVFQPGYQLRDLGELETFIRVNKHLPGIASADEMQREGMSVAETTTKLLEKIEELTLYLIEIKKENNSQKEKINELANFIAALQNKQ